MSEEEVKQEEEVTADEGLPTEEGKNERQPRKRDETPIEDLYDLSKPIPKADRPNKEEHDAELAAITAAIDAMKEERASIQEKVEAQMNTNKGSEIGIQRDALAVLRAKKGVLIEEKKEIRAKLDTARTQADKLVKDRKDTKANVRFSTIAEIDTEIASLQRRQETTSMSLNEEKRIIKEMDALKASKKFVNELKNKETSLEDVKEQRKLITAQIAEKDKELDELQKEIDTMSAAIKSISEKETDKRDAIKVLFTERDALRNSINDKMKERDACRKVFRDKNNTWFNYQRAVRAQKKMQYEEEKRKREEEKLAWLKKKEEEEAKKVPYEEEMALCDYLADYLTRTYLSPKNGDSKEGSESKDDVIAVKEDPFSGLKPVNKKGEDEYFGKGKGKKKRVRNKDKVSAGPFTLNVDTFEQFGLLNLIPPTSVDMVQQSVDELRAKKTWFSEQPRGSVPTAADIRKSNEKAAAKLKMNGDDAGAASTTKKQGMAKFSLDDFAPLGTGPTAASVTSTWGQKPEAVVPEPVSDEEEEEEHPAVVDEETA